MIIIRKPEEEKLLPLVREASHDGAVPDEEWQKHFLKIFEKELRGDPKQYMAFGYYWWILKKEFISHGIGLFGTTIDEKSAAMLDYGSTGLNLMACYSYYRDRRRSAGFTKKNTSISTGILRRSRESLCGTKRSSSLRIRR